MVTSLGLSGSVTLAITDPFGQPPATAPSWLSRTSATMTNTTAATASTPITTSARTRAKLMVLPPGRLIYPPPVGNGHVVRLASVCRTRGNRVPFRRADDDPPAAAPTLMSPQSHREQLAATWRTSLPRER